MLSIYFEDNQGSFGSLISSWKVMLASCFAGLVFIRGSQWSGVFYRGNVSCWVSEKNSLHSCKRRSRSTEGWWLIRLSNTCLPDVRNLCKWKLQMTHDFLSSGASLSSHSGLFQEVLLHLSSPNYLAARHWHFAIVISQAIHPNRLASSVM